MIPEIITAVYLAGVVYLTAHALGSEGRFERHLPWILLWPLWGIAVMSFLLWVFLVTGGKSHD